MNENETLSIKSEQVDHCSEQISPGQSNSMEMIENIENMENIENKEEEKNAEFLLVIIIH